MIKPFFVNSRESHAHSLQTLNILDNYVDFMRSIDKMADVGCGSAGADLKWWATRSVLDDNDAKIPLDINCTGIDILPSIEIEKKYKNIEYKNYDFETPTEQPEEFDVLWCHDAFQFSITPFETLRNFHSMLTDGGMMVLIIPQTTNVIYHKQEFDQPDYQFYNYTMGSLLHMLSVSGFDCKSGFFKKEIDDPWLHAAVYKSDISPMDPRTTRWYDLLDADLLPDSVANSVKKCGHLRHRDMVLPWLTGSYIDYSR